MKTIEIEKLKKKIKLSILVLMVALVISGLTAIPLPFELTLLNDFVQDSPYSIKTWIGDIFKAVIDIKNNYPFMFYGTDWLAFAHIVIAIAFIGSYKDPIKNSWVIQFGIISSLLIFPMAFLFGAIRSIPFYWQLIDCSFGLGAFIILYTIKNNIIKLEKIIHP